MAKVVATVADGFQNSLSQGLDLRQKQGLVLTPMQAQALQILTMPVLELAEYVRAQAEENPALELGGYEESEEGAEPESSPADQRDLPTYENAAYDEAGYEENWQRYLAANQYEPHLYERSAATADREGLSPIIPAREEQSLGQFLRLQLALAQAPDSLKQAALQVIEHLDDDGYFTMGLRRLAELTGYGEQQLSEALALVQSLEPAGVAARDLRECLRLQIGWEEQERQLILAVIEHHLPDMAKNRLRETARALKVGPEQVERVFNRIRALHPKPAAGLNGSPAQTLYIMPDIFVRKIDGHYQVFLNENLEPRLHISSYYRRLNPLLQDDEELAEYVRQKLAVAQMLIRNIEKRRQTIYRLAEIVVERQQAFLDHGLAELAPLTMKEVAEQADLHESTVSRAIAGKYLQTPRGVFEWKFFFPRAYDSGAGHLTPAWVKSQLAEVIAGEDKSRPFSDQQLQELLSARGMSVARRTVAKYREALGIPAKSMRRRL